MPRKVTGRKSNKPKKRSSRISSRTPPIHGSAHEDQVGRPMVRFLLDVYSAEQIDRMFDEESRSISQLSPPLPGEYNEVSMLPEPESLNLLSNMSSESIVLPSSFSASSSEISRSKLTAAPNTNIVQQPKEQILTTAQPASTPTSYLVHTVDKNLRHASSVSQKEFTCGFCAELGYAMKFTRAHDLRRHMEDTHHSDTLWICVHSDCRRAFQWLGVYRNHMATFHPKSRLRIGESETVDLCPQTVFACGFDECEEVFEARSALEAPQTKKWYTDHIFNHFRQLKGPKNWTFSTRIRNLLRQTDLIGVWPPTELSKEEMASLSWDPLTAGVIQKQLETRHLGDRDFLARNVLALGSNPSREVQLAQAEIAIPVLRECSEPMHHKTTAIAPMPATTPPFVAFPMPATDLIPISAPMMASDNAINGASSLGHGFMDMANGGYQQQPLIYHDQTQHTLDSIVIQPQQQQYNAADWSDLMQWINFDGEDNRRLM